MGALPPPLPDLIASSALTVLAVAAFVTAAAWFPFEAGIFPMITSGLMALFSLVISIQTALRLRRQRQSGQTQLATAVPNGEWAPSGEAAMKGNLTIIGLCLVLAALVLLIGHLAATFVFVAGAILAIGSQSWRSPPLIAAVTTLIVFAVFDLLASQPWPTPWLMQVF
jgi:hypothetical protein